MFTWVNESLNGKLVNITQKSNVIITTSIARVCNSSTLSEYRQFFHFTPSHSCQFPKICRFLLQQHVDNRNGTQTIYL